MKTSRPRMLLVCNRRVRDGYVAPAEIKRLEGFADWEWFACEGGETSSVDEDPDERTVRLGERMADVDGLIVCHGAPRISAEIMDRAPGLRIIGELEGDRFASRIDVEAAWARGIRTVDTTNASSYPVAE